MSGPRRRATLALAASAIAGALLLADDGVTAREALETSDLAAPATLHETGLYRAETPDEIDPGHLGFAPQYPLWTDGAAKRRWISLPAGTAIDARDPDAWVFPVGTRFWKEFAFGGRPVETRYMEHRADGTWLFATYAWDAAGRTAPLVGPRGKLGAHDLGAGRSHRIPGVADCHACHMSGAGPVLGFSTLQLAGRRDPGALHAEPAPPPGLTLDDLVSRGMIAGLDPALQSARVAPGPRSADQSAALGYLHGNCGHCHNARGPLSRLGLVLRLGPDGRADDVLAATLRHPLHKPPPGLAPGTLFRIEPGRPGTSAIPQRIASRHPLLQMPPLGTAVVDAEAVETITRWIADLEIVSSRRRHFDESVP